MSSESFNEYAKFADKQIKNRNKKILELQNGYLCEFKNKTKEDVIKLFAIMVFYEREGAKHYKNLYLELLDNYKK